MRLAKQALIPRLASYVLLFTAALTMPDMSRAQDWGSVPLIQHSTFQAINADGTAPTTQVRFPSDSKASC